MSWYAYWTPREGDAIWQLALADSKSEIIRENQPPLITILDLDTAVEADFTAEDFARIKYRGSLYFDFDSPSIDIVIPKFQEFLEKLEGLGVSLHQLHLFASGGKGFHILVPPHVFIEKPAPAGYTYLPHVYREMADALYVETLDMRVYTGRRGRMFRVPNVKRKNGSYKVPITVAEARAMTTELYADLTARPRILPDPPAPSYCSKLAVEFVRTREKVLKAMERRAKHKGGDATLIAKFKGDFPECLGQVMTGLNVNKTIGFHKIAIQLAIVAHKLNKTEDELVEGSAGLIENHESDGNRYNTTGKRRDELRRMYQYMHDNPCYDFTVGGLKSMLPPGTETPDLDEGYTATPAAPLALAADGTTKVEVDEEEYGYGVSQGMRVSRAGIFRKNEDGVMVKICALGFDNPRELLPIGSHTPYGYEVDVYRDGVAMGAKRIELHYFQSRMGFLKFVHQFGCNINANDAQIGALLDITRVKANKAGGPTHAIPREGLDILTLPGAKIKAEALLVYASKDGVVMHPDPRTEGMRFTLHGGVDPEGEFKSDIHKAATLNGDIDERRHFDTLFRLNKPVTLAKIWGFSLASWLCQPLRAISRGQFPYLMAYGIKGSGKSTQVGMAMSLHYNLARPRRVMCTNVTKFFCEASVAASASIPFLMDEYKPSEMTKQSLDVVNGIIKGNWDSGEIGKGGVDKNTGRLITRTMTNAAPIMLVGEAIITVPASVDRAIICPMRWEDREDVPERDLMYCIQNEHITSGWGLDCMHASLGLKMDDLLKMLMNAADEFKGVLVPQMAAGGYHELPNRPIHAAACIMVGLEFGRLVLAHRFGGYFDKTFVGLKNALLADAASVLHRVRSEIVQAFDALGTMSRTLTRPEYCLTPGVDYEVVEDKGGKLCLDLQLRAVFDKYCIYVKVHSHQMLYLNFEAYKAAFSNHAACTEKKPLSPIRQTPNDTIFRFDLERLYRDKFVPFYGVDTHLKTTHA